MRQPGLLRAERLRQFQAIVPDMRITLPGVGRGRGEGAPGLPAGGLAGCVARDQGYIWQQNTLQAKLVPTRVCWQS